MARRKPTDSNRAANRLVYSTEDGGDRRSRGKKGGRSTGPPQKDPYDGVVRVGRQTAGRKGKGVTVITGLALPPDELAAVAKALKKMCGSGGTVKDGVVEIQGDQREAVIEELRRRGFRVKQTGG